MKKTLFVAFGALASVAFAETPQSIDVTGFGGAKMVDEVVVPVPTEIFGVLDKLVNPKWRDAQHPLGKEVLHARATREETALLLGWVIAEGFIAVEATDTEEVKNIGQSVLSLASALSVRKVVVPRSKAIIEGADKKNWAQVRSELDKAEKEVRDAMRDLNDESLSQLVSLGGWLRGTEALTDVILQGYNKETAELLHQPVLVEFFIRKLENTPKLKGKPLVDKLDAGLKEVRPLVGTEGSVISEKSVKEIKAIAERLNKLVNPKKP
jgi:hypothetical protein